MTCCLSYVAFLMKARLHDFDFQLADSAIGLGASPIQADVKVVLPLLAPGMMAAGLLAFTLSIDDFVVTFFERCLWKYTDDFDLWDDLKKQGFAGGECVEYVIIIFYFCFARGVSASSCFSLVGFM